MACNFTVLVQSHQSHQLCFMPQQAAVFSKNKAQLPTYTNCLASEHSGAFSILGARYFPHELMETKTELKVE